MQKIVIKTTNVNDEKPKQIVAAKYINVQWKIEEKKMNKALTEPDEDGKKFLGAFERIYVSKKIAGLNETIVCERCFNHVAKTDKYEDVLLLYCNEYKWKKDGKEFSLEDQKNIITMQKLALKDIIGLSTSLEKLDFIDLHTLTLTNVTLSKNEYMCMMEAKNILVFNIIGLRVTNMDFADILKTLPSVIVFRWYVKFPTTATFNPAFYSFLTENQYLSKTVVKKISKLPFFSNLKKFELCSIRNNFDLRTFGDFVQRYKDATFILELYGTEKYLKKIDVIAGTICDSLTTPNQLQIIGKMV